MSLGKRVKEYREKNNIDQKDFAEKIEVTQPYLSHLENGKIEASERVQKRIMKILENETQEIVETSEVDNVKSPKHYMIPGCNFESIDIIRQRLGDVGFMFFLEGNVSKYLIRAEKKNGKEDYEKARKYLSWLVDMQKVIPHELAFNSKEKIAEGCGTDWLNIIGGISIDMKTKKALILNEVFNQLYSANYGKASELVDALLKE